ncbi:MAG: 5-methyltetrahydropteroyltriglutamate--homocysteine methyltransferase, partial [Finegoldia magna]|nr:5-methyltetrahydropteroyltriglutamate--homocysteine methyltransferase [Finegoldia magna]
MSLHVPFRYDYVGSFLRDEKLLKARSDFEKEIITKKELTEIEDECIKQLIDKQKELGYHVITDGEFRRKSWHLDFFWGLNGIKRVELDHGYYFHGKETYHTSVQVEGKITGENHPFVEHFKFVKQFEDENTIAKQTIPAPAQLLVELFREDNAEITKQIYPDYEKLEQDIAQAYRQVIKDLYEAGCRNIQFDDCTWGMLVDSDYINRKYGESVSLDDEANKYLRINNLALEDRPKD